MSFINFGGGGEATLTNIDTTYERLGYNSSGSGGLALGQTITTGTPAGTKGIWYQLVGYGADGVTANALTDLEITISLALSSGTRFLFDFGIGPDSATVTPIITNLFCQPGTGNVDQNFFPVNIPAGTKVWARACSSVATNTCNVQIRGLIRTSAVLPRFNNCEELVPATVDGSATPKSVDVTTTTTFDSNWTTYILSTARTYGAFVVQPCYNSSVAAPATSQVTHIRFGYGGSGVASANLVATNVCWIQAGSPMTHNIFTPIYKTVTAGNRIAIELVGNTGDLVIGMQVWGLY